MSVDRPATRPVTLSGLPAPEPSRLRWLWYLPGVLAVVWGVHGLLTATRGPAPIGYLKFVVIAVVAHDAILAPLVIGLGWLVARVVPPMARAPIQVGLLASGVLVLAGMADVLGYGYSSSVPSALPFDYGARLAVLLGVLWAAVLGWIALRLVRQRSAAATSP